MDAVLINLLAKTSLAIAELYDMILLLKHFYIVEKLYLRQRDVNCKKVRVIIIVLDCCK